MKDIHLGIFGATGLVGQTMISLLEERKIPLKNISFFASARSAGTKIPFRGKEIEVLELTKENIEKAGLDVALSALDSDLAKEFVPYTASLGTTVIDNSSAFRMDPEIPLIVPEVNGDKITEDERIIANPNCSTIQSVVPLKPIYDHFGIKRIIFSTYQSTSGSGVNGLKDLEEGIKGNPPSFYPHPIAYNLLPHIDDFLDNGYTKEEMKMVNETKKILGDDTLGITATAVRVPVRHSHSVSINVETKKSFTMEEVRKVLEDFPGLIVQDDVANLVYPMTINTEGKDEVFVGRIRRDESIENGINLWCTADNIRKGAALNTVQILEKYINL
ncbi:MAG: aspartate-semialdehyde dehydrogenase [Tissierellia bacterium]|nr:aspartate-semialdehyde dehydrogenase [Tissierellia bacterium]